jgi:hypothetical protein
MTPDARYLLVQGYPYFSVLDRSTGNTETIGVGLESSDPSSSDDAGRIAFIGYGKNRSDIYVRTRHIKPHE